MSLQTGEVVPIQELKVPKILYKYRSFKNSYHVKSLYEPQLYTPPANRFNDPYDSKIPFRYKESDLTEENIYYKCLDIAKQIKSGESPEYYQEEAFRMQRQNLLSDSHHLEVVDKRTFDRLCNTYGILCLTPNEKNLLMWSYYADSHFGFCIGYDTDYLINPDLFPLGGEIAYRNDFPKLPLFLTEQDKPLINILFTKWEKWQHENEFRLIHKLKKGFIHPIDKKAISEVILGCNISDKDKLIYTERIRESLPDAKIYQIELDKNNFGLNKIPISDEKFLLKM